MKQSLLIFFLFCNFLVGAQNILLIPAQSQIDTITINDAIVSILQASKDTTKKNVVDTNSIVKTDTVVKTNRDTVSARQVKAKIDSAIVEPLQSPENIAITNATSIETKIYKNTLKELNIETSTIITLVIEDSEILMASISSSSINKLIIKNCKIVDLLLEDCTIAELIIENSKIGEIETNNSFIKKQLIITVQNTPNPISLMPSITPEKPAVVDNEEDDE